MREKKVTKKMKDEYIRRKLAFNPKAAQKALLMIYGSQTPMERAFRGQILEEKNGSGFTAFDSEILSSLAEQLQHKGWLSERQNLLLLRKMPRYARQIIEIVGEEKICDAIRRERASANSLEVNP